MINLRNDLPPKPKLLLCEAWWQFTGMEGTFNPALVATYQLAALALSLLQFPQDPNPLMHKYFGDKFLFGSNFLEKNMRKWKEGKDRNVGKEKKGLQYESWSLELELINIKITIQVLHEY